MRPILGPVKPAPNLMVLRTSTHNPIMATNGYPLYEVRISLTAMYLKMRVGTDMIRVGVCL